MKTRAKRKEEAEAKKRRNEAEAETETEAEAETITGKDKSACNSKINDDDDSSSSSSSPPPLPCLNPYICVYCGTPCAALYRQLNKNSLSSIKAMHCEQCQRIVDPYIEREWLLVVIDCILLRPEAYRHILYNNEDFSWYVHAQKNEIMGYQGQQEKGNGNLATTTTAATATTTATATATATSKIQRLVQWTLVSCSFHAYLKWQTLVHTQQQHQVKYDESTLLYATFVVTSVLDLAAQWLAIYGFMKLLSILSELSSNTSTDNNIRRKHNNNNDKKTVSDRRKDARSLSLVPPSHSIAYQIYLGLLLPTSFQVVCVLVLLWENSKTTRALGSFLVACWQYLGISLISINSNNNNNGSSKPSSSTKNSVLKACTPLVGIVSLIAWRFGVGRFLFVMTETETFNYLHRTIPCVGFEMDVFGDVVNVITNEDFGASVVEWVSLPLLLCIT
jgi:hypothetical protein